ncbi:hypothetical protein B0F90DRAFT_972971 [Multifurca ochricompacta]|uniref:Cytochrome P450 n=1 Tax=Multifurca ochricompacta TaxID=376703 RepID=A0AAD4M9C1_9AGAM|nr:hypothetical protein B0F90DRAFT_972971 [Multifurca ochricompacta]
MRATLSLPSPLSSQISGRFFTIPRRTQNLRNSNQKRFLDTTTPVPLPDVGFGFGRRVCPGRYFVRNILWVAMASMLATFEFLPVTDAEGRPVPPLQEFAPVLTSGPMPFKCTIRSRSSRIKET